MEPLSQDDPRELGGFTLRAVLGSGGMGRVYLGESPTGYAAIKRVHPQLAIDKDFLRRYRQELENQSRLPGGVGARLLVADYASRPPWFATEYVPGVTLQDAVDLAGGRLPAATCWMLLRELAARLGVMSGLGMMHRDLKPSNIMLTADGLRLIDFGVARAAQQSTVTRTGHVVGTPAYMAPEQASAAKPLTPAVDVFSLGSVITFAATGEPPFGRGGPELFYRIVHDEPALAGLAEVDEGLAELVRACLDKDPAARVTAVEVAEMVAARARPGLPDWPEPVASRIQARVAFAAVDALKNVVPETHVVKPRIEWRPRRMALFVLPLVVAASAGVVVLRLIPFSTPHHPLKGSTSHQQQALGQPTAGSGTRPTATHHHGSGQLDPGQPGSTGVHTGTHGSSSPATRTTPSPTPRPSHSGRAVVSTYLSLIENVAQHVCVTNGGSTIASPKACTTGSSQGWRVLGRSGETFKLTDASGNCLTDEGNGFVGVWGCSGPGSTGGAFWRIGAVTAAGGTVVNVQTGKCLAWANQYGSGSITTLACNPSDSNQLWYDGGRA